MNFRPGIKQKFFENPDENIRLGNERWVQLWGGLRAGPFNTHCLAETWNEHPCTTEPQPIPGIPPSPGPPPGPAPAAGTTAGPAVHDTAEQSRNVRLGRREGKGDFT